MRATGDNRSDGGGGPPVPEMFYAEETLFLVLETFRHYKVLREVAMPDSRPVLGRPDG